MDGQVRDIQIVVQQLDLFNPENKNIEHFLNELAKILPKFKVTDETFVLATLAGCIQYKSLLDVVMNAFYIRDGKNCLQSDRSMYAVVCYLAIFHLEELGLQQFRRIIKSMNVAKICKFLRFFFNIVNLSTWIKDEWSHLYDSVYVIDNWIKPLQRWQPKVQQLIDDLEDKVDKFATIPTLKLTEPKEFHFSVPNPRPILIPKVIQQQEKTKSVPATTYQLPRLKEDFERMRLENREKAEKLLLEANVDQFSCAAPKFGYRGHEIPNVQHQNIKGQGSAWMKANASVHWNLSSYDHFQTPDMLFNKRTPSRGMKRQSYSDMSPSIENVGAARKKRGEKQFRMEAFLQDARQQPSIDNSTVSVKLNAAAILREEAFYQRKVEEELNRTEHLLRGDRDLSEFLERQKQIHRKDLDQQLAAEECKRLQGKLSYEEAIRARQNLIQENQKKAEHIREQKAKWNHQCMKKHHQEMKRKEKLVQQVVEVHKNVKEVQTKLLNCKRQIAQELAEENQEILRQALKEEEEEFRKRCKLIQEIRAIEYVPTLRYKFVDLTQVANHCVFGEMSIVELQERLALLREAKRKAEEEKRDMIIHKKHEKEQLLLSKLENISMFREQNGRQAALKQEQKKTKTPFRESILKNEQVLDLQKKIAECKTQSEHFKNASTKFKGKSTQKETEEKNHWKKLEESRQQQFKILQQGFISRAIDEKMTDIEAMRCRTNACILRS